MKGHGRWFALSGWTVFFIASAVPAAPPETGFQPEVFVRAPTRFDWPFLVKELHPSGRSRPEDYRSTRQRYQLFVPEDYRAARRWPLVVFVSPGDEPFGDRYWEKVCAERGMLFCAAYGAGNNCPPARRVRIVLDMFDDVRRRYRIDPDQTYLAGFSGGARLACTLAFSLPEYCGGVVAVCAGETLPRLDYLRHRVEDRLSVALVTGGDDFNRREVEDGLFPSIKDLGVRTRLWVVPKMAHTIPPPDVLDGVCAWLDAGLKHRRDDARAHPRQAASDERPDEPHEPEALLGAAGTELRDPERLYRGAALLEGILARWPRSESAAVARARLRRLLDDPRRGKRLEEQQAADQGRAQSARARALERAGQPRAALAVWESLSRTHPASAPGKQAAAETIRLSMLLAAAPYLGVAFEGESATVQAVVKASPASRAGLRPGDTVVRFGAAKIASLADVRAALAKHHPGDRATLEIERDGTRRTLHITIGTPPEMQKNN